MDFVSPENVLECVRLTNEFRLLPMDHRAREDKLEVCWPVQHSATILELPLVELCMAVRIFRRADLSCLHF